MRFPSLFVAFLSVASFAAMAPSVGSLALGEDDAAPKPKKIERNEPELVKPEESGALRLTGKNAEIYGPELRLTDVGTNLAYWKSQEDYAQWKIAPAHGGKYEVWIEWSCDESAAGNVLRVSAGEEKVDHKVGKTKDWHTYERTKIGEITLEAGEQYLKAEAAEPIKVELFDLALIELVPAAEK